MYNNIVGILNQGLSSNKYCISVKYSNSNIEICRYLYKIGLINCYKICINNEGKTKIAIYLSYNYNNKAIRAVNKVSTNGRKVFIKKEHLHKIKKGNILILSTSKGIMSDSVAKSRNLGGEVLFIIRY